jgi:hypothetical protein
MQVVTISICWPNRAILNKFGSMFYLSQADFVDQQGVFEAI